MTPLLRFWERDLGTIPTDKLLIEAHVAHPYYLSRPMSDGMFKFLGTYVTFFFFQ
jgi:hypothetical protein